MAAKCASIQAWLSAYLDGEVDARRRERVAAHLAECDACRNELDAMREVSACLRAWPAPDPRPELTTVLLERLAERKRQSGWWPRVFPGAWPRAAWAAGIIALALAATVVVYRPSPRSHTTLYTALTGRFRRMLRRY